VISTVSPLKDLFKEAIKCVILDLPFNVISTNEQPYLAFYLQSNTEQSLYVSESGVDYHKIGTLTKRTFIGIVTNFTNSDNAEFMLTIDCKNFEALVNNGDNLAAWGEEIIKFRKWHKIAENLYHIQEITRGYFMTQEFISSHQNYEYFIMLEKNPNIILVSEKLKNKRIFFKIGTQKVMTFNFQNKANLISSYPVDSN
jgi:hypothetical protein